MTKTEDVKPSRRDRRSPERQERRDNRAALGKEISQLQVIPPLTKSEVPPKRGPLLKRAMEKEIAPMRKKLFCLLAAYADGGNNSPPMRSLAARMSTTLPNVMWLLRALELEGWIKVEWITEPRTPNTYTLVWRDGS